VTSSEPPWGVLKELDLADFDDGRTWLLPEHEGGRGFLPLVLYPFGQQCSVVGNENVSVKWHWFENGPGNGHEHVGKKNESDGGNVNDNANATANDGVNEGDGENVNGDGGGRESGFGGNVDEVYPQRSGFFPTGLHSSSSRRPVWVSRSL